MRKLILSNHQSPGDIVMLTAAVRDLHRRYPGEFLTDVRTPCSHLWENNPHITALHEDQQGTEFIDCEYPLIDRSNQEPWHFLHGFIDYLNRRLDLQIALTEYRGDIHVSATEKSWISQVQEISGDPIPFWIVSAGGKFDYTINSITPSNGGRLSAIRQWWTISAGRFFSFRLASAGIIILRFAE